MKYYDVTPTADLGCPYNILFGERSNGKTTSVLLRMVKMYAEDRVTGVYVRQMDLDLVGARGAKVMRSLKYGGEDDDVNLIEMYSDGLYDDVKYQSREWYLGKIQEDGSTLWEREPFCYAMSIFATKHDKGATPARVRTILLDEFIPLDGHYLVDETATFRQLMSTIIRGKDSVQIFLCANAITWNSPYFKLFGATKTVRDMEQGDTTVLTLKSSDDSGLEMRVAIEYCEDTGGKKSDVYFQFADEASAMITSGKFAIPDYPKCPHSFSKENVKCTYWFHIGDDEVIRSRLMKVGRDVFVFNDSVTTDQYDFLVNEDRDIFYSLQFSGKRNHYLSPLRAYRDSRTMYLAEAFAFNRMFFSNNNVGEDLMYFAKVADKVSILSLTE